ncbi:hypothetical protein ACOMHN_050070 [Nucella lapillus]
MISNHSDHHYEQPVLSNLTFLDGCTEHDEVIFTELDHSSGHGHHGVTSSEVEIISRKVKDGMLILLFLIAGPGNIINMAVFFKQGLKDRVNLCLFALSMTDEVHMIMAMIHHGEQLHIQFTTKERIGPIDTFLTNNNLLVLMGFNYVSYILSAIIACERCLCIFNPLKFQTLIRTRTMSIIIIVAYIAVLGLYFISAFRHRIACVYDPAYDAVMKKGVEGDFYKTHREFIDNLDSFVFGVGLPAAVTIVVITTTKLTTMKLREIVTWRTETSTTSISPREVALTKMLVGNSILFLSCILPVALLRFSWLFVPGLTNFQQNSNFLYTTLWISEVFTFINASLNIFVYYIMGSRYRETFWALFGKKIEPPKNNKESCGT